MKNNFDKLGNRTSFILFGSVTDSVDDMNIKLLA